MDIYVVRVRFIQHVNLCYWEDLISMCVPRERWYHYTVITYFQCDSLQKKVESPRILLCRYMNNVTKWYSRISTPTNQRSYTNIYTHTYILYLWAMRQSHVGIYNRKYDTMNHACNLELRAMVVTNTPTPTQPQYLQTSSKEWVDWFLCRWLIKTHSRDCI